jgi:chaperonin GroEL
MLGDIAVMTGATFFSEDLGRNLEEVELNELGTAKKIVVNKDSTVIVEGAGKKSDVKARVGQIEAQIEQSSSDYDREKLQERLAKLTGGVAVLRVGGHTEVEMKERKDRVDDAIHATRAAAKEGFVPGGGVAALRAITAVSEGRRKGKGDEKLGFDILAEALRAPARQISENAGHDGDVVVEKVLESKGAHGFNAGSGAYEDLVKAGILDPALVVKTCIRHAASVAGLMLTTDVVLTDLEEKAEPVTGATA